jgi:C-terminal processing protease CtpA/Prc
MKVKLTFIFFLLITLFFAACQDNEIPPPENEEPVPEPVLTDEEYTNQWTYDQMRRMYLWNDALPASPDYTQHPEKFFYSILYKYGDVSGDRFSWIEEDLSKKTTPRALYADAALGFDYIPSSYFQEDKKDVTSSLGLFVISVNEGSDAQDKGLKRGQVIYQVNGKNVDYNNYGNILKNLTSCTLGVYNNNGVKEVLMPFAASAPDASPVFISQVITVANVKIAYLMYNSFQRNATDADDNYEYDIELIQSIQKLKEEGITEFVLDLRYNLGGYLTSVMDLASALVPNRNTKNVFIKEQYNPYFTDSLKTKYGEDAFLEYFLDRAYGTTVPIPALPLSRLYVLATEYSASASELLIHGLRPYMDVFHIGLTTVGKDKGSISIKTDDSRILWQLQPIVSRLTDANGVGNYINGLTPDYKISEWEEGYQMVEGYYTDENGTRVTVQIPLLSPWKGGFRAFGDPEEPLLATAIEQITGIPRLRAAQIDVPTHWVAKPVPLIKIGRERGVTLLDK